MPPELITLHCTAGRSDKLYRLKLSDRNNVWTVDATWGRRGGHMSSQTKVVTASYAQAMRVFEDIAREKLGKGYVRVNHDLTPLQSAAPAQARRASTVPKPTVQPTRRTPELEIPADRTPMDAYIDGLNRQFFKSVMAELDP
jgi:predicted DNA-binding WGR domain protein